jgi:predicted nucleic-acid-binding Zn-ribbon protein
MCNGETWEVQGKVYQLTEFQETDLSKFFSGQNKESTVVPVIPVFCKKCGYTALVSSVFSGFHSEGGN